MEKKRRESGGRNGERVRERGRGRGRGKKGKERGDGRERKRGWKGERARERGRYRGRLEKRIKITQEKRRKRENRMNESKYTINDKTNVRRKKLKNTKFVPFIFDRHTCKYYGCGLLIFIGGNIHCT